MNINSNVPSSKILIDTSISKISETKKKEKLRLTDSSKKEYKKCG